MRWLLFALMFAACGRIGFDSTSRTGDPQHDACVGCADTSDGDAQMIDLCSPSGACQNGPECGSPGTCCGPGEQCVNGVCECGGGPACTGQDFCTYSGPAMEPMPKCGSLCCHGFTCPI